MALPRRLCAWRRRRLRWRPPQGLCWALAGCVPRVVAGELCGRSSAHSCGPPRELPPAPRRTGCGPRTGASGSGRAGGPTLRWALPSATVCPSAAPAWAWPQARAALACAASKASNVPCKRPLTTYTTLRMPTLRVRGSRGSALLPRLSTQADKAPGNLRRFIGRQRPGEEASENLRLFQGRQRSREKAPEDLHHLRSSTHAGEAQEELCAPKVFSNMQNAVTPEVPQRINTLAWSWPRVWVE